eukprot:967730-Prymnesium_polylepis.1
MNFSKCPDLFQPSKLPRSPRCGGSQASWLQGVRSPWTAPDNGSRPWMSLPDDALVAPMEFARTGRDGTDGLRATNKRLRAEGNEDR